MRALCVRSAAGRAVVIALGGAEALTLSSRSAPHRERGNGTHVSAVSDMLDGYQRTCLLLAASQVGLFAALRDGPQALDALAGRLGVHPDGLARLVRALAAFDIVVYGANDASVALSEYGRPFAETSRTLLVGEQYLPAWTHLANSVRSGEPSFPAIFGCSSWEYRRRHPEVDAAFADMIRTPSAGHVDAIFEHCDLSGAKQAVDVGGGSGWLLAAALERSRSLEGILFDQPHVLARSCDALARPDVAGRVSKVGGSFFDPLPAGADVYFLQSILHDWSDDDCVRILGRCRDAMGARGRLLVLERVMPHPGGVPSVRHALLDLHMMVMLGGRERTLPEYDALLRSAGLKRTRFDPTPEFAPDIIEAVVGDDSMASGAPRLR